MAARIEMRAVLANPELWDEYEKYVRDVLRPLHTQVDHVFASWKNSSFWSSFRQGNGAIPEPIQHIQVRDKRLESVLDKFQRQPTDFPNGKKDPANLRRMRDLLGARIVVYVPDQLRLIDDVLRTSPDLELVQEYPPRCYLPRETFERIGFRDSAFEFRGAKNSGYSSVHYFVRLQNPVASENPVFEIQTRTMLEQVWGEIEHQLGYKVGQNTEFSVARQFRVISHHLAALDDHFDFLYDRLTYLQGRSNPVDADVVNAENLPRIMHDHQILLRQGEVDSLLRILATYEINTVGDLRRRLRPAILDPIREAYSHRHPGEPIGAFDVLPTLTQVGPDASSQTVREAYENTAEYGELIRQLRKDIRDELRKEALGR